MKALIFCGLAIVTLPLSQNSRADATSDSLDVIAKFADRLCQTVPIEVTTAGTQLSGEARAELAGVVRKLADIGIKGAAKYTTTNSKNVLQGDLAKVLQESRQCRKEVWNDLKDKFEIGTKKPLVVPAQLKCVTVPGYDDTCACVTDPSEKWKGPGQPMCAVKETEGECECATIVGRLKGHVQMK